MTVLLFAGRQGNGALPVDAGAFTRYRANFRHARKGHCRTPGMAPITPPPPKPPSGLAVLRLLGDLRAGEGAMVFLLALNCFVALVAYYVLKVVREPLILNTGGATAKSYAAAVQALALMALVPLYGRLLRRSEPGRLVQRVVLFFLVCVELFYLGAALRVPYLGFVFFVWVGIFSLAIVAQFWSFANDLYDTEAGERLFPVVALGAASGSIFGSFLARQLLNAGIGPGGLLQVAASLLIVHILLYGLLLRRAHGLRAARALAASEQGSEAREEPVAKGTNNGLLLVLASPYLRRIALLLVALNVVNTTGEFILSSGVTAEAKAALAVALTVTPGLDPAAFLDQFVGRFYAELFTLVNVTTLLLQGFLASRLVARFGIAGVLFALPLVALGAYSLIVVGASLAVVRIAKVAENSTDYSIMNTARAMLWLPTTRTEKYAGKQAVDTFFVRLGDLISAGVVWAGTNWLSSFASGSPEANLPRVFAVLNLVVIGVWLWLAADLARRYRRLAEASEANPD
jgi:ATP:ADP antiporter, AAA family